MNDNKILVSGSIVYDRIMVFPGFFKDHILPEQTHILNVSFTLERTDESFGGTGGNIAYNLALFKEPVALLGLVGHDFGPYQKWLAKNKIDTSKIKKDKKIATASAYIMTDKADNQLTGFFPGSADYKYCQIVKKFKDPKIAIISPDYKLRMLEYAKLYKKLGIDYIFDPGQQVTTFNAAELKKCIQGAKILIGNDYEIKLISNILGKSLAEIKKMIFLLIVTKGAKGSDIYLDNEKIIIPAASVKKIVDPTGAGDAYRAGLIHGLVNGKSLEETGRIASVIAAYAVEKRGTQNHKFTLKEFKKRYKNNYKTTI